jgi:hypothetical protein
MANARTQTVARGYEFFRDDDDLCLEDINRLLSMEGLEPIHQRSFAHYHNLYAYDIYDYVPINRFDVGRSRGEF